MANKTYTLIFFIVWWCDFIGFEKVSGEKGPEQLLVDYILSNYSRLGRPVKDPQKAVNVSIELSVTELISMDEATQTMSMYAFVDSEWFDEHIHWIPGEWHNLTVVALVASEVWLPDFRLDNSLEFDEISLKYYQARIHYNGKVEWSPGRDYSVMCNMDTTLFPFDIQTCKFQFENWMYPDSEVRLLPRTDTLSIKYLRPNNEWDIKAGQAMYNTVLYTSPYSQVSYEIHLKRKARYYCLNILFPCIIISTLSILVFFIPPQSGEKISFGMSVFVAFTIFLILVGSELPESSEHTPYISILLLMTMHSIGLTLISSTIIIRINDPKKSRSVPYWMRNVILWKMAMVLGMRTPIVDSKNTSGKRGHVSKFRLGRDVKKETMVEIPTLNINAEDKNEPISSLRKEIKECFSANNKSTDGGENDWLECAKIVERFFLVLWIILYFVCAGFLLYGVVENMYKWESL